MVNEFADLTVANEIDKSVSSIVQAGYSEVIKDRGIASANLSYRPYKFGKPVEDILQLYRKFFYNEHGQVVKKFDFSENGVIEAKEESTFEKWNIKERKIITLDYTTIETFEYALLKGKHKLKRYSFFNPKWPRPKVEIYEHDKQGRIFKKTTFGLLGEPELITRYLYGDEKDTKVTYRYVTLPDETTLVLTLMYEYDSKKEKQTGLYSFFLTPEQITELRKSHPSDWTNASMYRCIWEFDANGNNNLYYRDEMFSTESDLVNNPEESTRPEITRVLTEKTSKEYELINKKYYLGKETEWLTRIDEPLKAAKEFQYFNKKGEIING